MTLRENLLNQIEMQIEYTRENIRELLEANDLHELSEQQCLDCGRDMVFIKDLASLQQTLINNRTLSSKDKNILLQLCEDTLDIDL